jgi:hypothetical protein
MSRWGLGWAGSVAVALWAAAAAAEPYFAVREGQKCSACHVNMTGGGMRTSFVSAHAREILHYPNWLPELTKPAEYFTGEINQYVAIGADLRVDMTAIMQDDPGPDGRVDNNVAFRGTLDEFEIEVNQATTYLNVNLIPDLLNVYLDQRWAPSVDTREAWAMALLPWDAYLKAGKMFLPYGIQLQDDTAFIRGGRNNSATTGFSFNVSQPAFEIGWEPGPVSFAAAASQGIVDDRDVQGTGTLSALFTDVPVVRSVLIGTSGTYAGTSDGNNAWVGAFTGFNLGRFTYLGEVDWGFFDFIDPNTGQRVEPGAFITYSEGNYLLFDWLNMKVAFDYADYDGTLPRQGSDAENRVSVGFEPFLARFLQTRFFYRCSNGIETNATHNQDLWIFEVHTFF